MCRYPTGAANSRLKHLRRPLHRSLTGPDGHEHTGKIAHHVMEKGIGPDIDDDQPAVFEQLHMMNCLDRRLSLALPRAECTEVVRTHQGNGSCTHPLDVQRTVIPGNFFC